MAGYNPSAQSSFKTQRFTLIASPDDTRGKATTKDQYYLNFIPELVNTPMTGGKQYHLVKRPGLTSFHAQSGTGGVARGLYFWELAGQYYYVYGNTLYGAYPNGTAASILTFATTTGYVGFTEFRSPSYDGRLIVTDGKAMYMLSKVNDITQITQVPAPHLPYPLAIDGYVLVAQTDTQRIYNSNVDDPLTWDQNDDYLDAEMFSDNILCMKTLKNYAIAIGRDSIEFFYDAALSTGSPFSRNAPLVQQYGTIAPDAIAIYSDVLFVPAELSRGGKAIMMLQDFKGTDISEERIRQAMELEGASGTLSASTGFCFSSMGHRFYMINFQTIKRSFIFDIDEKIWVEWGYNGSMWLSDYSTGDDSGSPYFIDRTSGDIYQLEDTVYADGSIPITCIVQTDQVDMGSINRKRIYRLSMIGDSPNGDVNSPISIDWSDDDFNTYSTPVTLEMNGIYPAIRQLGITRRRGFRFTYTDSYPIRLEAFELDYTIEQRF